MITTSSIPKSRLSKLPDAVLSLISMGQYTLYSVSLPSRPDVVYALRIGAQDIFLLTEDGEPVDYDSLEDLKIKEKIIFEDVTSLYAVHNFSITKAKASVVFSDIAHKSPNSPRELLPKPR